GSRRWSGRAAGWCRRRGRRRAGAWRPPVRVKNGRYDDTRGRRTQAGGRSGVRECFALPLLFLSSPRPKMAGKLKRHSKAVPHSRAEPPRRRGPPARCPREETAMSYLREELPHRLPRWGWTILDAEWASVGGAGAWSFGQRFSLRTTN